MLSEELRLFVNAPQRVGTLSTVDRDGNPNAALVGSAYLPDTTHLHIALGDNYTLENLRQGSHAVFSCYEPAELIFNWQGARFYLAVDAIEDEGPFKEMMVQRVEQQAGKMAARTIVAAIRFSITGIRPLLDGKRQP